MDQDGARAGGSDDDVFVVLRPQTPGRFVFASPHSGTVYPPGMGADRALAEASLRSIALEKHFNTSEFGEAYKAESARLKNECAALMVLSRERLEIGKGWFQQGKGE